jgi:predicted TIM-barrel fold metal-dependent hydrolase
VIAADVPDFVDTHLHLWDLSHLRYPWLEGPEFAELRNDYLPADLRDDIGELPVTGLVHVQAEYDHDRDPVDETRWLSSLDFGPDTPPVVFIAYADLRTADLADTLKRHRDSGPVRGVRQEAWFDPASTRADIPRTNLLDDPSWRAGLETVAGHDLCFELLVWPHQLQQAAAIFAELAGLPLVLEHTALPPIGDADGIAAWSEGLHAFADAVPHAVIKVSALPFIAGSWTTADIAPVFDEVYIAFGRDRMILGSNFPVDRLGAAYSEIWSGYAELTREWDAATRTAVFSGNARRIYRIDDA